ncbi:MAG: DNA polymerase Y family protein [Vulcanimicrobiaceae bacterium]
MTALQAQAAAPECLILIDDAVRCTQLWEDALDALDAVTPLIDDSGEGTAFLWMHGAGGSPQTWIGSARAALCGIDLPFRLSSAPNKFSARCAALLRNSSVCESGQERAILAPLSVEVLEIEPAVVARLELLGIRTLGDVAKLPHGPFVRRFGARAAHWHDLARGLDATPFIPRPHALHIGAHMYGEGSVQTEEQLYFALRMLAGRVHEDLTRLGKRARELNVRIECENGDIRDLVIGIAQPTAEQSILFDLTRAKVEGLTFDAPVSGVRLGAAQFEDGATEATLFSGNDPDPALLELAVARLEAALDARPARARLVAGNHAERQFDYDPFGAPAPCGALPSQPGPVPPQLQLHPVQEIDVHVLQKAPAFVGSPPQAVLDFAGPWRVDETWFERPVIRDEYDVLLEDGTLYRIFRQGSRWYVRGAYD